MPTLVQDSSECGPIYHYSLSQSARANLGARNRRHAVAIESYHWCGRGTNPLAAVGQHLGIRDIAEGGIQTGDKASKACSNTWPPCSGLCTL